MKMRLNTDKNRTEWVLMNMRLLGCGLSKKDILDILDGNCIPDISIEDTIFIKKVEGLLSYADKLLDLQETFSIGTLNKVNKFLSGCCDNCYRKSTPVLYHIDYIPVLPQEIEDNLKILFIKLRKYENKDIVEKAVFLHNEIIRIYPFKEWSEVIARLALIYTLCYYGKPFCNITLSETDYNTCVMNNLKGNDDNALLNNIKLNLLMEESSESFTRI